MTLTRSELQKIPKVELHRHLECSMRLSTLLELAKNAGIEVPKDPQAVKDKFLVTEPMHDLEAVLKKFLVTQKVLDTEEILTRITREVIEDAAKEGIRILELRYAPTFVQQGHPNLSFERIHQAIVRGMNEAKNEKVAVGLIAIIQRVLSLKDAENVTAFAIENKETFIGLDLADNEVGFEPRPFRKMFERAKSEGLGITIHSGESPGTAEFVRQSIEELGAQRIGHGLQIAGHPDIMKLVRDRNVPLELCPTSNWLTNAVPTLGAHPFRKLMEADVPVTVNSDDPGVFNIDLVNEYEVLNRELAITPAEFDRCNDTAASASFLPLDQKQKYWPRPIISS